MKTEKEVFDALKTSGDVYLGENDSQTYLRLRIAADDHFNCKYEIAALLNIFNTKMPIPEKFLKLTSYIEKAKHTRGQGFNSSVTVDVKDEDGYVTVPVNRDGYLFAA